MTCRSARRKILHLPPTISNPLRLDQSLAFLIQVLVGSTNRSIADACNVRDLLCSLRLAKQVRSHVYAGSSDRERRATSEVTDSRHLISQALRDFHELLILKTQEVAE